MRQSRIKRQPQRGAELRIHDTYGGGFHAGTIETVSPTASILRTAQRRSNSSPGGSGHPVVQALAQNHFTHVVMISHTPPGAARETFCALVDRHGDYYDLNGQELYIRPAREVTAV